MNCRQNYLGKLKDNTLLLYCRDCGSTIPALITKRLEKIIELLQK
jgi:hypothetical protein